MSILNFHNLSRKKYYILLVSILPIIFISLALMLRNWQGPYWLGKNSDPEYAYLLNFLNIIQLKTPGHTDHPGTSLQILGGLIIQVTYLIQNLTGHVTANLTDAVLENPEFYLSAVSNVLIFLNALSIFVLGAIILFLSGNLISSLLLQSTIFLWTPLIQSIRVSPEPLLFCLSQILVSLLLFYLYSHRWETKNIATLLGIVLGLGIATKITFFPLILVILLLPHNSQKTTTILSLMITFLITTLPIILKYPRFGKWILSITIHTGRYGTGEKGVINWSSLPQIFAKLFSQDNFFFYLFFALLIFFFLVTIFAFYKPSKQLTSLNYLINNKNYILSSYLFIIILIQLILTIKHPGIHYLLPAMGLSGLLIYLQIRIAKDYLLENIIIENSFNDKHRNYIIFAMVGMYFFLITGSTYNQILLTQNNYASYLGSMQKIHDLLEQNAERCNQVSYYRSSSKEYSLKFGDDFADNQYSLNLQKIYPKAKFYNIWSKKYYSFTQELKANNVLNKPCVLFHGTLLPSKKNNSGTLKQKELANDPYSALLKTVKLKPLFQGNSEGLYLGSAEKIHKTNLDATESEKR